MGGDYERGLVYSETNSHRGSLADSIPAEKGGAVMTRSCLAIAWLVALSTYLQAQSNYEWCGLVEKNCIQPHPSYDEQSKRCGIGKCRHSPCPGERCQKKFKEAQQEHCNYLNHIQSGVAPDLSKKYDDELKQEWSKYNAGCNGGGDPDCLYADIGPLSDDCPAPPDTPSPACRRDIEELHNKHCQNVAKWWAEYCSGKKADAQNTFNDECTLKKDDYPDLTKKPECQGATLPPFDNDCFPGVTGGCGGHSRTTGSQGGDGPVGGGGGGGGGNSGGGGEKGPNPPPIPQRPVHAVILEILRPPLHQQPKPPGIVYPNPRWLAPIPILQLQAAQQLAAAQDRIKNPAPAPDYVLSLVDEETQIDLAAMKQVPPPDDADAVTRSGFEGVNAMWRESGFLDAFASNYARYLGAKAAGNQQAMLDLAKELTYLIDHALNESLKAAQHMDSFESQIEKLLSQIQADVEANGGSWPATLQKARNDLKKFGLPKDVQQELKDVGISESDIKAFQQQLTTVTPESIDADMAALKSSSAPLSQTLYIADVQSTQQLAHKIREDAQAADKAAKEAAAKFSPAPGPGPQQPKKNSPRSMILSAAAVLLALLAILAFVVGVRSAKTPGHP